jgi:predicted short-subunit dehydrogenase-like oxidoreductase (DUF2520 family)
MSPNSQTKPKPSIAIIGAGRLGQALALALSRRGYPIVALVARHRRKAEQAAAAIGKRGSTIRALTSGQLAQMPAADIIVIATPDDAIQATAQHLSRILTNETRATVLHTSGALSSEILTSLTEKHFETGSIHPLVSISNPAAGADALRGAFYCLEGTRKAKAVAASLVRALGGSSFNVSSKNKALYHAAAVMASPHLVSLFDLATGMLEACGLSKRKSREILAPLLASTVNNLKTAEASRALTGTFARGDIATVRRHLKALAGEELAPAREVYKLLGLHALKLAEQRGLEPCLAMQIASYLKKN